MTTKIAIEHRTTYDFDRMIEIGPHVVRLRPAPHSRTPIESYSLRIDPADHFLNWQQDPFGNFQARLVFPEKAKRLEIIVDLIADMTVVNPFDFFLENDAEHVPFLYEGQLREDLEQYLTVAPAERLLRKWMAASDDYDGVRTIDFLVSLIQRLAKEITYSIRMEPGVQTPEQTLERGIGSCRDTAWLLVNILRHMGYAARFVSGYLVQLVADETPLEGPSGPTEDFTDLHAWTEVFLPGAGWVGMDPTSGLFVSEGHIPLAATPTPSTAAPIAGLIDDCEVEFSYANTVRRIHEDPRVTKPYSPAQWAAVEELGQLVDRELVAGDVRLTMGGEPTFVSIDDAETPEWNTEADGPAKRELAADLTARLWDRFAAGGVIHHGQGKWYPGEPLPRWQKALVWRTDGEPVWQDRTLLANPDQSGPIDAGEPGAAASFELLSAIAQNLGLDGSTIQAAWEDPIYQLWQEAQLPDGAAPPEDLDPTDSALVDEDGRRKLTKSIDEGAGAAAGWVLPLHRSPGDRWATSPWSLRRGRVVLTPGDSPLGYRLPINSLGWDPIPPAYETSPFDEQPPLPDRPSKKGKASRATDKTESAEDEIPPTALTVEVRDGHPHVFLPPMATANEAIEILTAVESAAALLATAVVIEGYPIPGDPRLETVVVTPDPGVIEVNVPPARNWEELKEITLGVAEEARLSRLGAQKFDLDGTHTGTGGGNHITIGGPKPADSPLLRRPDLLRSLITYWQHHPALSYLFSGRFIGPSSQAPRVDEARDDNLYELETAFAELDRISDVKEAETLPWVVDRLLRHLLVDLTGNTHRSEFCIDKLYSPDGQRGRLGLLELRGFEMPPHPEMALVQALLVRTLVARFWKDPYRHDPVRFGTALHDRYLLPWFVEEDVRDVTADLKAHGLPFEAAWLDPFMEFRFPRHGTTTVAGVTLEVRGAVEPWHVLGEEATGTGMARYVDSSVERLQLRVDGLIEGRHVVTCNGAVVPLTPTSVAGTAVAGIRFKAWQPPSGLHPTMGIDSPLTFDVHDLWNGRSLGGCRYHVVHQGGLSYDSVPVNSSEAESRRQSRFEALGHSPGAAVPHSTKPLDHREYPVTLDLRRAPKP